MGPPAPRSTTTRMSPPPPSDPVAPPRRGRTAPLLFGLVLLLTLLFSALLADSVRQQQQARFDREVAVYTRAIEERLTAYADVLRAARALRTASGGLSGADFQRFVTSVNLDTHYPGIQRLGWAQWVRPDGLAAFLGRQPAPFRLQPPGARAAYAPVTYLAPLAGAQGVLGYDMYSDPVRRAAIDRAVQSGREAATPGVNLRAPTPAGGGRRGFILYLPVYAGGLPPTTPDTRQGALLGLLYAPIGTDDFLAGAYPASRLGALQLHIEDAGAALNSVTLPRGFRRSTSLAVADRRWTLTFAAPESFGQDQGSTLPWLTALLGLVIAGLVYRGARNQEDARARAEDAGARLAGSQARLARAQAEFEAVFRSMQDTAVFTDNEGRVRLVNDALRRSFGLEPAALLGQPLASLHGEPTPGPGATLYQRPDGQHFQAEVQRSEVRDEAGMLIGQLDVIRDVTERLEAERVRRAADRRFQGLLEALPQLVWTTDPQGRTTYHNQGWTAYTGQTPEEALGDGWLAALHPDDAPRAAEAWRRSWQEGAPYEVEYRLRREDGVYHWFVSRGGATRDERGAVVEWVGTCTDIQARIEQDAQLRRSEARSRQLIESLPQIVWVLDDAGQLTFVNERWRALVPEAYHQDSLGAVWPEDRAVLQRVWAEALRSGEPFSVEYRLLQRGGRYRSYLTRGLPLRDERGMIREWIVTSTDIDDQVYAETSARLLAEFSRVLGVRFGGAGELAGALRLLTAPFAASVLLVQGEGGTAQLTLAAVDGREQAVQQAILDRFPEVTRALAERVRLTGQEQIITDRPALAEVGLAGVLALPLLTRGGEALGALIFSYRQPVLARDLDFAREAANRLGSALENERLLAQARAAEQQLTELNQSLEARVQDRTLELQEANRELEAFSYSVSHDLRTPLRHVVGFADLLRKESGGQLGDKSERYLGIISDAARRMSGLIDDLLNFSRMGRQPLRLQEVALGALFEEARAELEPETEGREVLWRVGPLPTVRGDPGLLKLVILNLLTNALKYSRKNVSSVIELGSKVEGGEAQVWVRDNGVGFDSRFGERLFGVFQRLHRAEEFEGTGIGLANVRRIVTRHGGRVWAESELGQGATFSFSLPLRELAPPALGAQEPM